MTEDYQARVQQFEARVRAAVADVRSCVRELQSAEDDDLRYLLAERMAGLGSAALPELLSIMAVAHAGSDLRYLAAWVAVEVGDRDESVRVLCDEVARGSKWSVPAASVLGRHGVVAGRGVILAALERVDLRDGPAVAALSEALKLAGGALPGELRARLVQEAAPWIARAVEEDFPGA